MKGFPKVLKTKEDYYNCLAMVASGELAAADLLAKIESAENQRYIECWNWLEEGRSGQGTGHD